MSQSIQAIYENGLLRPLTPLDLPENSVVEIDVRDVKENSPKPNENVLRVIQQVTEKQKDMHYTSSSETQKILRDARNGGMFLNEEKLKAFHDWMENLDSNTPNLTDEQISHESVYEE